MIRKESKSIQTEKKPKLLQEFSTSEEFKKAEESVKVLLLESRNEDIRWILTVMFDKKTKPQ